jgi:hypothetical protein
MLNRDGSHNFAATYKEHLKNVRAFKVKPKESNCTKKVDNNKTKVSL